MHDEGGNAVVKGLAYCPEDIIIKGRFKSTASRDAYPVEEIGTHAFSGCGSRAKGNGTKTVFVPKEIKIIKSYGLDGLHSVEKFTIERGSQLQSIEFHGLAMIGTEYSGERKKTVNTSISDKLTLILPPSLQSVIEDSIYLCNRFTRIIYCGTSDLDVPSKLESTVFITTVYVTRKYNHYDTNSRKSLFGRRRSKNLDYDVIDELCTAMSTPEQTKTNIFSISFEKDLSSVLVFECGLFSMSTEPYFSKTKINI